MREFLDEEMLEAMLTMVPADNTEFLRDTSVTWHPAEETITDMLRWTVEQGVVASRWVPALAP